MKVLMGGVGGSGLSAIAGFLAGQGYGVYGFDRSFEANPSHPMAARLASSGIQIVGQDGQWPEGLDLAVMSTAVEPDRPEVKRIMALGITLKTRPEYLAEIASAYDTVAVAGTSGKSTSSGMLAYLMRALGMRPNFIGGGRVANFEGIGNCLGDSSRLLVIEACESDGSIIHYHPRWTVLLNVSLDHHSIEHSTALFRTLLANTSGSVIHNTDDPIAAALAPESSIGFSVTAKSQYQAGSITLGTLDSAFSVGGCAFRLNQPGLHNVMNALSSIALLNGAMDVPLEDIAGALPGFRGIGRRFEIHLRSPLVVDDYAHNPHKIDALMKTMRNISDRVCYIFQPHGFGPTRLMKDAYIETFNINLRPTDRLVLLPIFYAGGTAAMDISSRHLADGISGNVTVADDRYALVDEIAAERAHNAYVVLGARDESLSSLARGIGERLS